MYMEASRDARSRYDDGAAGAAGKGKGGCSGGDSSGGDSSGGDSSGGDSDQHSARGSAQQPAPSASLLSVGTALGHMAEAASLSLDDPDRYVAAAAVEALRRLGGCWLRFFPPRLTPHIAGGKGATWEETVATALVGQADRLARARFCRTTAEAGTPF
jgi:hypothetical protein